ncbi:MAG: CDP-glucose 4,6-dehydratase [Thermodesulfovibrionales bacterium]
MVIINKKFWHNKKVLITGHTGFKGSWLSLWLQKMGAKVLGYSLPPPTQPSLFEIAKVAEGMISVIGDIRDLESLQSFITSQKPEIIIHMAAQSLVHYGYENPVETYSTNVMGTVNILEAVRQTKCARVVLIVTSDKCYENKEWVWGYRENDPIGGNDPYSSSKGCAELVTSAYRKSYFSGEKPNNNVAVASVRAGNVIGGGDWSEDRLIPDIMKAFIEHRPVLIRNPQAIRPWQYVLDVLHGYLILAERLWNKGKEYTGEWNFGPLDEDAKPVSWIVNNIKEMWGDDASWKLDDNREYPKESFYLKLNSSKARSKLQWKQKLNLEEALNWTVQWYRNFILNKDMRNYTELEIYRYETLHKAENLK